MCALLAFEMFNFDTTRYALGDFLGGVTFMGVSWASVLAVAFCSIDFAGLVRFFLPNVDDETPTELWYLMGAWLLGATMNAVMTWWAVSLVLLEAEGIGNAVLNREALLNFVPVFVAVLVWLTRILFIGAFSVAGGALLQVKMPTINRQRRQPSPSRYRVEQPPQQRRELPTHQPMRLANYTSLPADPLPTPKTNDIPQFLAERQSETSNKRKTTRKRKTSTTRKRTPKAQPVA